MAITDKQRTLMRDLISNTDESAKNIAKEAHCCERTVRTEAERIGNTKFKEKHAAARVSSNTQDPITCNYLAELRTWLKSTAGDCGISIVELIKRLNYLQREGK